MSPSGTQGAPSSRGFPRVSGDEPRAWVFASGRPRFPRVSGDEPQEYFTACSGFLFPRVSGDEPALLSAPLPPRVFSLREWG